MLCNISFLSLKLVKVPFFISSIQKNKLILDISVLQFYSFERLFLAVTRGYLLFVIVVFPDHTHLLVLILIRTCCIKYLKSIYLRQDACELCK